MKDKNFFYKLFDNLNIKKNDIIYLASDSLSINLCLRKQNIKVKLDNILDCLIKILGKEGTLVLPTFNWDFCNKKSFDYHKTVSKCGSLSNLALNRKEFKRTLHPIYSFAVYGKYQKYLCNMKNKDSWSKNSPFNFFANSKSKFLFLGIDYKKSFTMDHYYEQKYKVNYRYKKNFKNIYIDKENKKKIKTFSMFVRKRKICDDTKISSNLDKILIKNKIMKEIKINKTNFGVLKIPETGEILSNDLKAKNYQFIFPIKYDV